MTPKPPNIPEGIWQQMMQGEWADRAAEREKIKAIEMAKAMQAYISQQAQQGSLQKPTQNNGERVPVSEYVARIRSGCDCSNTLDRSATIWSPKC